MCIFIYIHCSLQTCFTMGLCTLILSGDSSPQDIGENGVSPHISLKVRQYTPLPL